MVRRAYGMDMRRYAWLVIVTIVFSFAPREAVACSCVSLDKSQYAANAALVFTGTVTSVTRPFAFGPTCTTSSDEPVVVVFDVDAVYKGDAPATVTVRTASSEASCGYAFTSGTRYTVFATVGTNGLETNLCRGNIAGAIAPQEDGLGAGRPPRT